MITYRKIRTNDKSLVNKLIIDDNFYYQEFLNMGWSAKEIFNQFQKKTNFSYAAFYNNYLISFILGDLFNIEKITEYEILLIYVCKNFRKKGIAKKLIKIIEEKNKNLNKIYLEVSKNNNDAICFYKKMNFKKIYIRKNYFLSNKEQIDAIAMVKSY